MDPNANLMEAITLAEGMVGENQDELDSQQLSDLAYRGQRLAELVLALDVWLRRGGFPPQVWEPIVRNTEERCIDLLRPEYPDAVKTLQLRLKK
jgi:hypothetical protein